jgi:DNA-binding NarL/FixJ family response regulator
LRVLDTLPPQSVYLIVLDAKLADGTGPDLISRLRYPESRQNIHLALHLECVIVGWSGNEQVAIGYRHAGADGFLSKLRDITRIVPDLLHIIEAHRQGCAWVELL